VYDPLERPVYVAPTTSPQTQDDHLIFYLSFDQMLCRESEADKQGLGAFFRYSYQNDQVFAFNHFWSLGLSYTGPVPRRDKDVLGFGFAQQIDSDEFRRYRNPDAVSESVFELYYAIEIFPWLVVTPDIQYVNNPGGDGSVGQTIAGGIRVRASF
jgi:porin